ncbi:MAG: hypothetical protein WD795_21515 [Woeseia sp.]
MADESMDKPPRSFWIASGAALVWNLLGMMAYVMHVTMTNEAIAALPDAERMLYENTPAWATAAFATAVTAGTLGSVLLLLRKAWAVPVLIISLVAVLIQILHMVFMTSTMEVMGAQAAVMPILVALIAIFLVWYARGARTKGWLR